MQLAWQSNNESASEIRQAMDGMKQVLCLICWAFIPMQACITIYFGACAMPAAV